MYPTLKMNELVCVTRDYRDFGIEIWYPVEIFEMCLQRRFTFSVLSPTALTTVHLY